MENEFVDYSTALALKELGFDGGYLGLYVKNQVELLVGNNFGEIGFYDIKAPLYQQAFRWLYQKLDIEKGVMPLDTEPQQLLLKELIDKVSSKHLLV